MITALAFAGIVCLYWKLLCFCAKATFGFLKVFLIVILAQAFAIGLMYVTVVAMLLLSLDRWIFCGIRGLFCGC